LSASASSDLWVRYLHELLSVVWVGNGCALGRQMPLTIDCNNLDSELLRE